MTNKEFEKKMTTILKKIRVTCDDDFFLNELIVSTDPDLLADFGCDENGNLVLGKFSTPFKIADLTNIKYRCNLHDSDSMEFDNIHIRFTFGESLFLECISVTGRFMCTDLFEHFHIYCNGNSTARIPKNEFIKEGKQYLEKLLQGEK